jgi:prophage antirepressor-like protein
MNDLREIMPFDVEGASLRFGVTEAGIPFVVAADFARAMGYRQASDATRLLDQDEAGQQIVLSRSANGTEQRREMNVIYEDGIWELIFRSSLPGAKAIKSRVKAILREIRETGRYEVQLDDPLAEIERQTQLTAKAVEIARRERAGRIEAEQQVRELEPAAHAWDTLASADGDYAVADAAKILSRDPAIKLGRDRLFRHLREDGWAYRQGADSKHRAKQYAIDRGWLSEIPQSHYHPRTGELVLDPPQVRVTVKGLQELHKRLGGVARLRLDLGDVA